MENKVLSIEQMKHLIELGVDVSSSSIFWCVSETDGCQPFLIMTDRLSCLELVPTFTLQDAFNILPKYINGYTLNWYITDMILRYDKINGFGQFEALKGLDYSYNENVTIMDVIYDMLCNIYSNGLIGK